METRTIEVNISQAALDDFCSRMAGASNRRAGSRGGYAALIAGSAAVLLAGWTAWSYVSSRRIQKPRYRVLTKNLDYELRDYEPYIVAETDVKGSYADALRQGFRVLYNYISGDNSRHEKIPMTAPVIEKHIAGPEKAIEVGPNAERAARSDVHTISFVMPPQYTLETLPAPNDPTIRFRQLPARKIAALQFSGYASPRRVEHKKKELMVDLIEDKLPVSSEPQYAVYTPPFTVPFLSRNEILAEVA